MNSAPFAIASDDAPAFWLMGNLWIILVDGEKTGGRFTLIEQLMPQGTQPIPHVHHFTDEWFYIIEGSMDAVVNGQTVTVKTGGTLWIPRDTEHSFLVTSPTCRVLNGYEPAGVEQMMMHLAQPATSRELPPPGPPPPAKTLTQFFNNYWAAEVGSGWEHGIVEPLGTKRQ